MTLLQNDEIVASIVVGFDGSAWMIRGGTKKDGKRLESFYNEIKDVYGDTAELVALKKTVREGRNGREIKILRRGKS
jgi:hypothetical protein